MPLPLRGDNYLTLDINNIFPSLAFFISSFPHNRLSLGFWQILLTVFINLDSLLKSRDITLPTKVRLVKIMVFPGVMYGCESWTIKKAERQRIDAFELWCWRRLLRVPWTVKKPNQSILKEISPEYSLEGCWSWNSNTLATWCKELTHLKRPWCWERLRPEKKGMTED